MRNLMPINKLDAWKNWLLANSYDVIQAPIPYSPFGVRVNNKVLRVYVRDRTHAGNPTVHASLHGDLVRIAKLFLRESNQ